MSKVLVTGGTGYIGSHTALELLAAGHEVVLVDNFANSNAGVLPRLEKLAKQSVPFEKVNLCDKTALAKVFDTHQFTAVIHFAGLKAVDESVAKPLQYYFNNLVSTLNLCELMEKAGVSQFIFSSSATVYGDPASVPINEDAPLHPTNPYGQTKFMIEQILKDWTVANPKALVTCLRYFNPVGAHPSGEIGEDPAVPNNLLPYVAQVAIGRRPKLRVFGNDYPTPDGTGVRDYIHVVDLAKGHVAALEHPPKITKWEAYNLGTGQGYSVMEVIKAFEQACGKKIPYEVVDRRPGDIPRCYADPAKAKRDLKWQTMLSLQEACTDTWRWQSQNPHGYAKS